MLQYIYCRPMWILTIGVVVYLLGYANLNVFLKKRIWHIIFNIIAFLISILIILYMTVFRSESGNNQVELRPFYTFVMAQQHAEYYRSFFMNCLLFVPMGLSMPYMLSQKPRKWIIAIPIVFACLLSVGIEYCQYYYHLGRCETDDVIANTLGAAVGTLSYLLYIRILKNREESLMNSKIGNSQKLLMDLSANALFHKEYETPTEINIDELFDESKRQTVLPQIFSFIKEQCNKDADATFSKIIAKNIRVEFGHNEVHKVLSENNISYVVLKGVASSSYYKEPMLRTMGDIDILVAPDNVNNADKALKSIGYTTSDNLDKDGHIAYKRRDGLVCELHHKINGIPDNAAGQKIKEYFANIYDTSYEYKMANGSCFMPSKFHHGLILLIHTATHLTHEGVGLRHLCDWAVFANSFSNDEFVSVFEKALKETGLWRFAQLLTLCCVKYLGCDAKEWAGECSGDLLEDIITDILNGGNFGYKDQERYNQIKYLSDRKSGEIAQKNPILQLFSSINQKTKKDFKFASKSKVLLPVGLIFTICKYLYLVIMGKRNLDSASTITGAKQRKEIYEEFRLFSEK